jgi:hypothetical protein
MAKKTAKRSAGKKGTKRAARGSAQSNLARLKRVIDPDAFHELNDTGKARIESLTKRELEGMISGHHKLSPKKRFEPDPDGSIF